MTQKMPKQVLITGAEGALGSQVALKFLKEGCSVLATHRPGTEPPNHLKSSDYKNLKWITLDITDSKSIQKTLDMPLDALVHCAGGFRFAKIEELSDQDLDFLINTNLKSGLLLTRHLVVGMKKTGFGRIVLVSARATLAPPAGMAAYTASKAGLNMLVGSVAEEVKDWDININAVMPTLIDTPANRKDMPNADYSKWVSPENLAEIIFMLTQPVSKSIHGALIPVAGRV